MFNWVFIAQSKYDARALPHILRLRLLRTTIAQINFIDNFQAASKKKFRANNSVEKTFFSSLKIISFSLRIVSGC